MVTGSFGDDKNAPPQAFGWFFIGIASVIILLGWTLAICNLLAGKYLKQHKNYTFCFVIAVISCMFAPLGTLLGVFTIIVLVRDSVKQLFNGQKFSHTDRPAGWQ